MRVTLVVASAFFAYVLIAQNPAWQRLSSKSGELPDPGGSRQQTAALVTDLDKDHAADIVIGYRVHGPALVWLRRTGKTWTRQVIDGEFLRIEAGGAAHDIDGDGDLDIVFGADAGGNQLWWWENPYPKFDATTGWKRRTIKAGGANQHHDQIFADVLGIGSAQLIFWNQRAKTLFLARLPADPQDAGPWALETVFAGQAGEQPRLPLPPRAEAAASMIGLNGDIQFGGEGVDTAAAYAEGLDAFDMDGDGRSDLLAGNSWFFHREGKFHAVKVGSIGGRIRAGRFRKSKVPQVVIAPGDGSGPLRLYECEGDPRQVECWQGRDLLSRGMVHGHTLEVGDVNRDGHLDIFAAEMAKWTNTPAEKDHADATAWILYGDGNGRFRETVLVSGDGWHEGKLADVDGDGDLDVINKPYTWTAPRLDIWINGIR
jgi:hypothetical protein